MSTASTESRVNVAKLYSSGGCIADEAGLPRQRVGRRNNRYALTHVPGADSQVRWRRAHAVPQYWGRQSLSAPSHGTIVRMLTKATQKPILPNALRRHLATSAYAITSLPAPPSCFSSSHQTPQAPVDYPGRANGIVVRRHYHASYPRSSAGWRTCNKR
jgi:hypothetical protein